MTILILNTVILILLQCAYDPDLLKRNIYNFFQSLMRNIFYLFSEEIFFGTIKSHLYMCVVHDESKLGKWSGSYALDGKSHQIRQYNKVLSADMLNMLNLMYFILFRKLQI